MPLRGLPSRPAKMALVDLFWLYPRQLFRSYRFVSSHCDTAMKTISLLQRLLPRETPQEKSPVCEISCALNRRSENVVLEAVIIAELRFSDIERQVLAADFMERTNNAALEYVPKAFNRLGVRGTDNKFRPLQRCHQAWDNRHPEELAKRASRRMEATPGLAILRDARTGQRDALPGSAPQDEVGDIFTASRQ